MGEKKKEEHDLSALLRSCSRHAESDKRINVTDALVVHWATHKNTPPLWALTQTKTVGCKSYVWILQISGIHSGDTRKRIEL